MADMAQLYTELSGLIPGVNVEQGLTYVTVTVLGMLGQVLVGRAWRWYKNLRDEVSKPLPICDRAWRIIRLLKKYPEAWTRDSYAIKSGAVSIWPNYKPNNPNVSINIGCKCVDSSLKYHELKAIQELASALYTTIKLNEDLALEADTDFALIETLDRVEYPFIYTNKAEEPNDFDEVLADSVNACTTNPSDIKAQAENVPPVPPCSQCPLANPCQDMCANTSNEPQKQLKDIPFAEPVVERETTVPLSAADLKYWERYAYNFANAQNKKDV